MKTRSAMFWPKVPGDTKEPGVDLKTKRKLKWLRDKLKGFRVRENPGGF